MRKRRNESCISGDQSRKLGKYKKTLEHYDAELLCVQVDVSKREDIEVLAKKAIDKFGAVHLLVNNAGFGAGLLPYHPSAPYQVTKHAVVALTENLYHSLVQKETKIWASVLCPGYVRTRIMEAERNRPTELKNQPATMSPEETMLFQYLQESVASGISPQEVAEILFRAIEEERLYVGTHPDLALRVQERMDAIMTSI